MSLALLEGWPERLAQVLREALRIWHDGGWAMWGLLVIALTLFGIGVRVHLDLRQRRHRVPEAVWRRWLLEPADREGPIGHLLDRVGEPESVTAMVRRFAELHHEEIVPFERDLRVMQVCVGAAPLIGLLGTVTGMLATFAALAAGGGGDQTMTQISKGISEALITTEAGLVVALGGLFLHRHLARRAEVHQAFLAHLQTVCTQVAWGHDRRQRRAAARAAARGRFAGLLLRPASASASVPTEVKS